MEFKATTHEAVPESQLKASYNPSSESLSSTRSKETSTQFHQKDDDVDLESRVIVSSQVNLVTDDPQEICNDRLKTLRPRINGKVSAASSKPLETNEKQRKKGKRVLRVSSII